MVKPKQKIRKLLIIFFIGIFLFSVIPYLIPLKEFQSYSSTENFEGDGQYISIDDKKIFYEDHGNKDNDVVVCIHGFGANGYSWRYQIPTLVDNGYRVIVIDLLGYGYSDKDWESDYSHQAHAERINIVLEELDISEAYLMGHSMGGSIAVHFAHNYQNKVKGLILVDGAVFTNNQSTHPNIPGFLLKYPPLRRWIRHGIRWYITEEKSQTLLQTAYCECNEISEETLQGYAKRSSSGDWDLVLLASTRDAKNNNVSFSLSSVEQEVLILSGEQDTWVKPEQAYFLQDQLPNSVLEIIPDTGHMPMEEKPNEVNTVIINWLSNKIYL